MARAKRQWVDNPHMPSNNGKTTVKKKKIFIPPLPTMKVTKKKKKAKPVQKKKKKAPAMKNGETETPIQSMMSDSECQKIMNRELKRIAMNRKRRNRRYMKDVCLHAGVDPNKIDLDATYWKLAMDYAVRQWWPTHGAARLNPWGSPIEDEDSQSD